MYEVFEMDGWRDECMRCVRSNNGFMDRRINIWGIWDWRINEQANQCMRGLGWMDWLIDWSMYDIFGMDGWPARCTNEWGVQLGWMARQKDVWDVWFGWMNVWMRWNIWMDYLHLSVILHRSSSITWLNEQNECWYLWVVVGSSDAAGSAGSLCAGSGPVGDPKAPSEWAWMSLSHTVCNLAD